MSTSHPFRHLRVVVSAALVAASVVAPTVGAAPANALGNGLAQTPPMGWNNGMEQLELLRLQHRSVED